ncbi:MAG: selenide, water dikinase SelD [Dehalococcoidia bacterium]
MPDDATTAPPPPPLRLTGLASCAGCAAKMGIGTLQDVLAPLRGIFDARANQDLLVGLDGADDAAVYLVSPEVAVIQTLDFFPPVVDDAYTYGAIAAANAMSDVYAMGGEVKLALNITAWPEDLDPAVLREVLRGGAEKVAEAGGVIAGGHTIFDVEPKYGLSVTGFIHPGQIMQKSGAQPGDVVLLTKRIGTGVLLTAQKESRAGCERGYAAAIESMLRLNRRGSELAREHGAHAMTDITGYALLGHAAEVATRSGVRIVIDAASVPLLPDAQRFAAEGATTGGGVRNRAQLAGRLQVHGGLDPALVELLYDPQTSGPLFIVAPAGRAEALRAAIEREAGGCWAIGHVEAGAPLVEVR